MNDVQDFAPYSEVHFFGDQKWDEDHAIIGGNPFPANDVWLDLGFKGWNLSDTPTVSGQKPFKTQGGTDRWNNLPLPAGDTFTTDDLFELRLEKKGLGNWTHAEDAINGGWKPEEVRLFVNGRIFGGTLSILPSKEELDKDRPAWRHLFNKLLTPEGRFLRGLRVEAIAGGSSRFDELIAGLTTEVKKHHISGWQDGPIKQYRANDQLTTDDRVKQDPPIESVSVVGTLINSPSPGTDKYVSLDLKLETVTVNYPNGTYIEYQVNNPGGVPHTRYIRVEYFRKKDGQPDDNRYDSEHWAVGERFYAEGIVKWDTDRNGFYEIHPSWGAEFMRRVTGNQPLMLR